MPLVTANGFSEPPAIAFVNGEGDLSGPAIDLPVTADPDAVLPFFEGIEIIRIVFASFADGRGFSLAKRLRDLGYTGRLRASGHVISDQFHYALKCGFDEIEIDDALASRQPEPHWLANAANPVGGRFTRP